MVLSLSPGPAVIVKAWHMEKYANMWRITDDFWDNWDLLLNMFNRCEVWQKHVGNGSWPDCDMIPLGKLRYGWNFKDDESNFTFDEERTMLTLWSIFRSPLILGCEFSKLNERDLSLITNEEVLKLNKNSHGAYQVMRDEKQIVWASYGNTCPVKGRDIYLALFNISDKEDEISIKLSDIDGINPGQNYQLRDLWESKDLFPLIGDAILSYKINPHGALLLRLK
jgi:hypothetical protein